jgi:hypothetical protein
MNTLQAIPAPRCNHGQGAHHAHRRQLPEAARAHYRGRLQPDRRSAAQRTEEQSRRPRRHPRRQGIAFKEDRIEKAGWITASNPIIHDKSGNKIDPPTFPLLHGDRSFIYGDGT